MLNIDQQKALDALMNSKKNIFLTGKAGTGKSYVINEYKKLTKERIGITSSTGVSAMIINGLTLHSFFGIGIVEENSIVELVIMRAIRNKKVRNRINEIDVLFIDEISMVHGFLLKILDLVAKKIRKSEEPFGGLRVIATGDFFQISPVTKNNKPTDWAFKSEIWETLNFEFIYLKKIERSKDNNYNKFLEFVRFSKITKPIEDFLDSKLFKGDLSTFDGTRLLGRKNDVQEINARKLKGIDAKLEVFETKYWISEDSELSLEKFKETCFLDEVLEIKVGALVMIRVNDKSVNNLYANGTLGHVLKIKGTYIKIKTLDDVIIFLKQEIVEQKNERGDTIATAENFPINLGWAMTIHKSQGATIDSALIDLTNLWDHGMAYVALSRVKSSKGLHLLGWSRRSFITDPDVIRFYAKNIIN